jgi:hypothetical protein
MVLYILGVYCCCTESRPVTTKQDTNKTQTQQRQQYVLPEPQPVHPQHATPMDQSNSEDSDYSDSNPDECLKCLVCSDDGKCQFSPQPMHILTKHITQVHLDTQQQLQTQQAPPITQVRVPARPTPASRQGNKK